MNNDQTDIIRSEHNYINVAEPVPVFDTHNHEAHIPEHTKLLNELETANKEEETALRNNTINILREHIAVHEQYKANKHIL